MSPKLLLIPLTAATLFATSPAFAQNFQNWESNQQNQIQQDASSGMLNANQSQYLQSRDAQIQAQQQAYLNQNGGVMTAAENNRIQHELANVNHQMGRDVYHNTGMQQQPNYNYMPANVTNANYAPYQWRNYNGNQYYNGIQSAQPQYSNNWGYRHHWNNNGWH